jgi:hypothetical protein
MPAPETRTPMNARQLAARFAVLQESLVPSWERIRELNGEPQTIVVVPSVSLDFDIPATLLQAYEERFLFILFLLRQPRARIVYVTSMPLREEIVEYFLSLLPGVIPSHARKRLHLVPTFDGSRAPLSRKILDRPHLLEQLGELIPDRRAAHLVPFNTTELETELAVRLGIPMYGCDPVHEHFGTKSGGRELFARLGVPHPVGREGLRGADDLVAALVELRAAEPALSELVVKLNESVSGEGNAVWALGDLPPPGHPDEESALRERLGAIVPEQAGADAATFLERLGEHGGIVEQRLSGEEFTSPSVQLRITPLGEVQVLSTHDQLLGGVTGQSYMGCKFPADPGYAAELARHGRSVGEELARAGVLGRFAVDFVCVREQGGDWSAHAIEINLRKGGTTHPYLTLEFLTDGRYDEATGIFTAPNGRSKAYVADDHVEDESLKQLTPDDVFDFVVTEGLHFGHRRRAGVVLHMVSAVTEHGRIGLTAVGDTPEEAWGLHQRATRGLVEYARLMRVI